MYKAAIFDMDLTLIDSVKVARKTVKELKKRGFSFEGLSYSYIAKAGRRSLASSVASLNSNKPSWYVKRVFLRSFVKHYSEEKFRGLRLLKSLSASDRVLGLVTNNYYSVVKKVLKNNKEVKFDAVYTWDDVVKDRVTKKELILRIVEKYGLNLNEVVYVGDMPSDMRYAREAGVTPIGKVSCDNTREDLFEWGAEYTIDKIEDLKKLLF